MKIVVTIVIKELITNSLLSSFVFAGKPKTRIRFSASWWSSNKKYLFFVYSESHSTSKSCRIQ